MAESNSDVWANRIHPTWLGISLDIKDKLWYQKKKKKKGFPMWALPPPSKYLKSSHEMDIHHTHKGDSQCDVDLFDQTSKRLQRITYINK